MNSSRIKHDVQKIFELWCEVSTEGPAEQNNNNASGAAAAVTHPILKRFPEQYSDTRVLADLPHFAFPCEFENKTIQPYSFVLTCTDSKFRFGFCHHEPHTKTAYVLITYLPWHDIFYKFLNVLVELRKRNAEEFNQVLQFVYNSPIPRQAPLKVSFDNGENSFVFQSPAEFQLPSIPENRNLNLYYNFVEPKDMIAIFAAMLNERRVIFTSQRLDILSSCIQAANHFLTPLCWQHIFIPVLPMKLKDFLLAPMPFLIGVPEQVLRNVRRDEIGEVVILHIDRKIVETPFDDVKDFPAELVSQLKKQMSNSAEHYGDRVSRIFLRVMVKLIGGYRDAVRYPDGGKITWDAEAFVETRPSSLRPYLRKMIDLQIFNQFIDERLEMLNGGLGMSDEFIVEMQRFDPSKSGKNYKEFLKNVKEKVKEGGKGVKTAYKDLKSKLKNNHGSGSSKFHEENNNHTTSSFGKPREHRRSAPSSPVFNKGPRSSSASSAPYATQGMQISMEPGSSSTMPTGNGVYPLSAQTSPGSSGPSGQPLSGSTSSSSSMSEINLQLWQELQHHDLFRSPPVDRSLKGNAVTAATGTTVPPPVVNDAALRPPTTMAPPVPMKKKISIPSVFLVDEPKVTQGAGATTYVRAMDRPPPRPIRPPATIAGPASRGGGEGGPSSASKCNTSLNHSSQSSSPPALLPLGSSTRLMSSTTPPTPATPQSSNNLYSPPNAPQPHPPPRRHQMGYSGGPAGAQAVLNRGGELQSQCLSVKDEFSEAGSSSSQPANLIDDVDLIKLDTSIELEDFDPLNQNAKPIPSLPAVGMLNGTNSAIAAGAAGGAGFNNPLYPYFEPPYISGAPQQSRGSRSGGDDDSELLRKYGLDLLTLEPTSSGTMQKTSTISGGGGGGAVGKNLATAEATRSHWTTFE